MGHTEVKFLELDFERRKDALRQMADLSKHEDYIDADNAEDISLLIANEGYNPDKDFYFMVYDDGQVKVRSQSNS